MKALLLIALIGSAICSNTFLAQPETITKQDAQNFLIGFALGLGVLNEIPDVISCASTASHAKSTVQTAIEEIKSGKVDQIVEGVQLLASFLDQASQGCGNTLVEATHYFAQVKSIVWSASFPKTATTNVLTNIKVTVDDVVAIIKGDDWILRGAYAGDIAKIVIFGEPNDK